MTQVVLRRAMAIAFVVALARTETTQATRRPASTTFQAVQARAATFNAVVADPKGRGRTFKRKLSTFMTGNGAGPHDVALPTRTGGGCACGKPHRSCGL